MDHQGIPPLLIFDLIWLNPSKLIDTCLCPISDLYWWMYHEYLKYSVVVWGWCSINVRSCWLVKMFQLSMAMQHMSPIFSGLKQQHLLGSNSSVSARLSGNSLLCPTQHQLGHLKGRFHSASASWGWVGIWKLESS